MNDQQTEPNAPTAPADERAPVPYERFAQVIAERNTLKAQLTERDGKERASGETLAGLQSALEAERSARLRLHAAVRAGLPADLAERLRGASEDELAQDAERLAAYLKPREYGVPPPARAEPRFDLAAMTPEQIRAHERELLRLAR